MAEVLRLVVAEDNLLVREGLVSLLVAAGDLVPTTVCSTLDELYEAVERDEPDVVVTDIRMPPDHRDEGIQAARRFRTTAQVGGGRAFPVRRSGVRPRPARRRHPRPRLRAEGSGGRGRRLAQAIRVVAAGGSFIDDEVVDALVRARTRMVDSPLHTLTARELDVLAEMATGATNAAIAESLGVSPHSIEKHSTAIFVKLGLDDAADVNRRVMAVLMFLAAPAGRLGMSRPGSIETASVTRLRTIILVDIGTALAATVLMVVVRLTVVSSSYLVLAAVLVALFGAVMAGGLRPLRRGDLGVPYGGWQLPTGASPSPRRRSPPSAGR